MPKVQFRLEEQFADLRSNEVAYKFVIENLSPSAIELLSITPRIPENVKLLEIRDPSFTALKTKHNDLCEQLNTVLKTQTELTRKEFLEAYMESMKLWFEDILRNSGPYGWLMNSFARATFASAEKKLAKENAYKIVIDNYKQAEEAFKLLFDGASGADKALKDWYALKMQWLKDLESEMGPNLRSSSLATIEADSFFAVTYVLKFGRNLWDAKKYNISIEGVYSDVSNPETKRYVGGATVPLTISPSPMIMTIIAVIASFLGLVLKMLTAKPPASLNLTTLGAPSLAAGILALVFFNIYEFTDLGKKLGGLGIGWRSAVFIGAICGLFGDRILEAIKTLLGIT